MSLIPNKDLPISYLYTDPDLIIINKQARLPVYPLKPDEKNTIANGLVAQHPELKNMEPLLQAGIVHRLDNDTSGILVVARNQESYEFLRKIWNTKKVSKIYTSLVIGHISHDRLIQSPIAHHPSKKKKMMVCETKIKAIQYKANKAITKLHKIKDYQSRSGEQYSLAQVSIITGVRHQIRTHLASIGHPVVGDRLYQNNDKQKKDLFELNRHFLHLSHITLPHPQTGKPLQLEAPLAQELCELMEKLKKT